MQGSNAQVLGIINYAHQQTLLSIMKLKRTMATTGDLEVKDGSACSDL